MTSPPEPEQGTPGIPSAESPPVPGPRPAPESAPAGPAWPGAAPAGPTPPGIAPTAPPAWPSTAPADSGPAPAAQSQTRPGELSPRRARRIAAVVALVVLGLAAVGGGAVALVREMGRAATKSEVAAALATEIAGRWERLPAGKIFPATVTYYNAENDKETARLVGIVPATSCRAALTPRAFAAMRSLGCHTMLRATYTDASGTLAASIGIGVMASSSGANAASENLSPTAAVAGMHAVPIPGTAVAGISDAGLGASGIDAAGPYVLLYAVGYTDGLPGRIAQQNPELVSLGTGIVAAVVSVLTGHPAACTMKDIRC
jgi:hypothetical protein